MEKRVFELVLISLFGVYNLLLHCKSTYFLRYYQINLDIFFNFFIEICIFITNA